LKCLENPDYLERKQWLTYWIIFCFLQILELFSDIILYHFPPYFLFKALLILCMILPRLKGASGIYMYILRPLLIPQNSTLNNTSAS
ncbi:TB2/DP1/HVA22-related protein, partial [Phycomyces blakesleeanus]